MREKKLIVGNWKMNFTVHEASFALHRLMNFMTARRDVEVVVAPTLLTLQPLVLQVDQRKVKLAAQNLYWRDSGAFTGEVSAHQVRGMVQYAIIGHSERRHIFHEHERDIRNKVQACIRNNIRPILCVGETMMERSDGYTGDVLQHQLTAGLANVTSDDMKKVEIAYEPVWAIGTGNNANPQDVQAAIKMIRDHIQHMFGRETAKTIRVLYGGSVTPESAGSYLLTDGVDGLLIGGASLDIHNFSTIIAKAHKIDEKGEG